MAKKKKTSYKCGHCGDNGHNARTCPNKASAVAPDKPKAEKPKAEKKEDPKVREPNVVVTGHSVDLLDTDRNRPSQPTGPGCFQCPKCGRASVLVLVQLPEAMGSSKEMRCELCHNKTPIEKILLWGAQPNDVPART